MVSLAIQDYKVHQEQRLIVLSIITLIFTFRA